MIPWEIHMAGVNDLSPEHGFRFFLNLVQSYHEFLSAHSSWDGTLPTAPMETVTPLGEHHAFHGTEELPQQLILDHPDFLSQQDWYNWCGIAVMLMLLEMSTHEGNVMFKDVLQSRHMETSLL